jgi:hypothetical protein
LSPVGGEVEGIGFENPSGLILTGEDAAVNARIILTFPETSRKIFNARNFTPTNARSTRRPAILARRLIIPPNGSPFHETDGHSRQRLAMFTLWLVIPRDGPPFRGTARYSTKRRIIPRDGATETHFGPSFHATECPKHVFARHSTRRPNFPRNY